MPPAMPLAMPLQMADLEYNPLVGSAFPLLSLAAQLRNTATHDDVAGLRNSVIQEMKQFETRAKGKNLSAEHVHAARYALCSLIDEIVLNTPWGCHSVWATQSLLITFHKEGWGGEKFFQILKNISQQPGIYLYLLELYYFCLSLGFEGKYRVQEQGMSRLEAVKEDLYEVIRRQRGDPETDLSVQWEGIKDKRNALIRYVPWWVVGAVAVLLLMGAYLAFIYAVNRASDPPFKQLYAIGRDAPKRQVVAVQPVQPGPTLEERLQGFLEPEVRAGLVVLVEHDGKTIIRIVSKGLFASGSDRVNSDYVPLLRKISEALETVAGRILVTGHTDDIPIFTARFPSNWHLSKARADSIATMLRNNPAISTPIVAEGLADNEPLVPNDNAVHRAINRRVEIII